MKKGFKIFLGIMVLFVMMFIIDFVGIRTLQRPVFAIWVDDSYVYKGLFYDTYRCPEGEVLKIKGKGSKFSCVIGETSVSDVVEIVDTTREMDDFICASVLEKFYEDSFYDYYFSCSKSKYVIVKYDDGYQESVSSALKSGVITVNDLDLYGISYSKESKNVNNEVVEIVDTTREMNDFMCAEALEKFYEDEELEYYFSCMKSNYVIVRYFDGREEMIVDALQAGHVSISDLNSYGIQYYTEKKD